jgi:hypothetical protein
VRQLTVIGCLVLGVAFTAIDAQEPEWTPSSIRDCDGACLVEIIDGYMNAIFTRDPKAVPPLAKAYRMTYMKHIRPRRVLIVDERKGLVGTFPLFVHDGTRRGAPADAPPGMIQNLVTIETFAIRDGLIHHVVVFPFFTLPYGMGNGWTPGSGK